MQESMRSKDVQCKTGGITLRQRNNTQHIDTLHFELWLKMVFAVNNHKSVFLPWLFSSLDKFFIAGSGI